MLQVPEGQSHYCAAAQLRSPATPPFPGSHELLGRQDSRAATVMSAAVDSDLVWRQIERASFGVLSYVVRGSEPRSSGVTYATVGRRLYIAVAPDSWKARQIESGQLVSVVVPIRTGGLLGYLLTLPPATVMFRARVRVRPIGSIDLGAVSGTLASALRRLRHTSNVILELLPQGRFLTYGVGVSVLAMRDPALAQASVPTNSPAISAIDAEVT